MIINLKSYKTRVNEMRDIKKNKGKYINTLKNV